MDISLTTVDVQKATGGKLLQGKPSVVFRAVGIDSRLVQNGDLFVAVKGENHDGHAFVPNVVRQGIHGVVIAGSKAEALKSVCKDDPSIAWVAVDDTIQALGDLAAYQRRRSTARVIGITGSNGKTTTRRLVATIFSGQFETLASRGNFNNEIGLPLTLLRLKSKHQWIVLELGMNHFGEIRRLSAICRPHIAIITNAAPCHLEGVGSIDGVVRAKAEIIENIELGGTVILNRDDPRLTKLGLETMESRTDKQLLFFGESKKADIQAHSIEENHAHVRFMLKTPESQVRVTLPAPGRFMVNNALAAAAAGYAAGLSVDAIRQGLAHFKPVSGRMNITATKRGVTIIDDTYNANPGSMQAAIHTLATLAENNRSVLVVGDMLELGDDSDRLHYGIGEWAAQTPITFLYATGQHADFVARGAREGGMAPEDVVVGDKAAIIDALKKRLSTDDYILIKGSRGSAMECIAEPLLDWAAQFNGENEFPNDVKKSE